MISLVFAVIVYLLLMWGFLSRGIPNSAWSKKIKFGFFAATLVGSMLIIDRVRLNLIAVHDNDDLWPTLGAGYAFVYVISCIVVASISVNRTGQENPKQRWHLVPPR